MTMRRARERPVPTASCKPSPNASLPTTFEISPPTCKGYADASSRAADGVWRCADSGGVRQAGAIGTRSRESACTGRRTGGEQHRDGGARQDSGGRGQAIDDEPYQRRRLRNGRGNSRRYRITEQIAGGSRFDGGRRDIHRRGRGQGG